MRPSQGPSSSFLYVYSCELTANVQVKICDFEGIYRDSSNPTHKLTDLFVQAAVYCNKRQVGFPISTSYKQLASHHEASQRGRKTQIQQWNEWLTLPIRFCDLSRDASVHFTIWELDINDISEIPSAVVTAQHLADGNSLITFPKRLVAQTNMPLFSKRGLFKSGMQDLQLVQCSVPDPFVECSDKWRYSTKGASDNLGVLLRQFERQQKNLIDQADGEYWLNQLTLPKVEKIRNQRKHVDRNLFLVIEMPAVSYDRERYDVVYYEEEPDYRLSTSINGRFLGNWDPELGMESLAEQKHSVMTRNARGLDSQLKPNKQAKDKLEAILKMPSSLPLTRDQCDLVWKFRYYLQSDKRALTKYLHSVNWEKTSEVEHALSLISDWAPIEAEDALELLSPSFTHPSVRAHAVSRLFDAASSDQMLLFLPQLVQALKYEPIKTPADAIVVQNDPAITSPDTAVETGATIEHVQVQQKSNDDLASFLIQYATGYLKMANFFYWHLVVEEQATFEAEDGHSEMYHRLLERLQDALLCGSNEARKHALSLKAQKQFVDDLKVLTNEAKTKYTRRDQRELALRTLLSKAAHMNDLNDLVLPLDPSIRLAGVLPESASMFNSAMLPVKLTFKTTTKPTADGFPEYTLIFKQGDDLRQDQLVIQMIRLMDLLFKQDQLDLRLTPYSVLATGIDEGFVQFIKAKPLQVLKQRFSQDYVKEAMREFRPDPNGPFGIEADVIDNYVRSLAGYSIVCYVLGVGDRHLDNLLLCENGKLFHVDFGFILGRDPKPMPPPMKLTPEMIAALGGMESKYFKDFVVYCDTAFRILRRHANVILNLFSLMLKAGIPDIEIEQDKAVSKIEQRLRLDISDEKAFKFIVSLICESANAKMGAISDLLHEWKQNLSW